MLDEILNPLKNFRNKIYDYFSHRRDAAMDLVDALSSNTNAQSVVELSLNPSHRRNYCSITRIFDEFYQSSDTASKRRQNQQLTQLIAEFCPPLKQRDYHVFGLDCTSSGRIFSKTLSDRSFVYAPNTVSGNKPVTIGHQYSIAAYLPEKPDEKTPPWIVPLSCERVGTDEKGVLLGMKQIRNCMGSQKFFQDNKICISVGDCAYSQPDCLLEAKKNPNQIHVSRARNNRIFYFPVVETQPSEKKKGRPKCYGKKFKLKNQKTWGNNDEVFEFSTFNKKGKLQIVKIECWNNIFMRGHRQSDMSDCPFRLLRIQVFKSSGDLLFQRPMWLIVSGEKRDQLSLVEIHKIYRQRFDLEHFFRTGKDRLLMNKTQTPETDHEEVWWQVVMISYVQLFLSRNIAHNLPNPWEKSLPTFRFPQSEKPPTQVQKDFGRIIHEIGTPAKDPKHRNKSKGRQCGELQAKRINYPVIIKNKKTLVKLAA